MTSENNTKLRIRFSEHHMRLLQGIKKHPEFSFIKNNHHLLSETGKYSVKVFEINNRLLQLGDDLDKIVVFLRRFPNKAFYESNGLFQHDYIKYHMEVFLHKIYTILEVKKIAINTLFNLGLKEYESKWEKLKQYDEFKDSQAFDILNNYRTSFKQILDLRNVNTHRAILKDDVLENLVMEIDMHESAKILEIDLIKSNGYPRDLWVLETIMKKHQSERMKFIKDSTKIAKKYIAQFETAIIIEYFNRVKNRTT